MPFLRAFRVSDVWILSSKRDVRGLLKALRKGDKDVAEAAAQGLGRLKDGQSVEPLLAVVESGENTNAALSAIIALGEIGDTRSVAVIKRFVEKFGLSHRAARALVQLGDKDSVPALVDFICNACDNSGDQKAFTNARDSLVAIGSVTAEPLIRKLQLPDISKRTRQLAAAALGALKEGCAIGPLIIAMHDEVLGLSVQAAYALASIGWKPGHDENAARYWVIMGDWKNWKRVESRAVEALLKHSLEDQSWDVRKARVETLGKSGDERVVAPLVAALQDRDEDVRATAAAGLGNTGNQATVASLIISLKDKSPKVRSAAAKALSKFGDSRAIAPLIGVLADDSEAPEGRIEAARALGRIGVPSLGPLMKVVAERESSFSRAGGSYDEEEKYHKRVALALSAIGETAVPLLIDILKDRKKIIPRTIAAEALGIIGDRRAVEPLIGALMQDSRDGWFLDIERTVNQNVSSAAAVALGRIGDVRAVAALREALGSNKHFVGKEVKEALGRLGEPDGTRSGANESPTEEVEKEIRATKNQAAKAAEYEAEINSNYSGYGHRLKQIPVTCNDCGQGLAECTDCGQRLHAEGYLMENCQLFYPATCPGRAGG